MSGKFVKYLAGALIAATSAGSALAQSSVMLYGQVDAWAGAIKTPGQSGTAWTQGGGGMSTSYWGMKGTEDLGNGLKAVFKIEGFFLPQNGQYGRFTGDTTFSRNAYVGLQSDTLGTLTMGRETTPYFVSTILFNPFIDSYTFGPMIYQTFMGASGQGIVGDSGWSNAVAYTTPDFRGLTANLAYAFGNKAGQAGQNKWGGNLLYFHGPFSATLAYQQVKFDNTPGDLNSEIPGFSSQRALQLGAAYDFRFVKLYGQYQYIKDTITGGNISMNGGQLGVSVPLGTGSVLASYAYAKSTGASDTRRNSWALGYDYPFSKRTDVYAAYFGDHISGLSSGRTYGVGIRTHF